MTERGADILNQDFILLWFWNWQLINFDLVGRLENTHKLAKW